MKHSCFRMIGIFFLMITILGVNGCYSSIVDAEITVNSNGSGKAKIVAEADTLFGMEDYFWEEIKALENKLRKNNINVSTNRHKGKDTVSATMNIRSKNIVEDLNQLGYQNISVTHHIEGRKHRIEIMDNMGIKSLKLNMPGKVLESNGYHTGSTVQWENTPQLFMEEQNCWAVSKTSGFAGTTLIFIILILFGVVLLVLKKKKTNYVSLSENLSHTNHSLSVFPEPERFCTECGNPMDPLETFCSECGSKRE